MAGASLLKDVGGDNSHKEARKIFDSLARCKDNQTITVIVNERNHSDGETEDAVFMRGMNCIRPMPEIRRGG